MESYPADSSIFMVLGEIISSEKQEVHLKKFGRAPTLILCIIPFSQSGQDSVSGITDIKIS